MSYDIEFKVKIEGIDQYVTAYQPEDCLNITWNVREMICASTGLEWKNEANNGLVKDVIPAILKGYTELSVHPEKYKKYESPNGYGTVEGCRRFFKKVIDAWEGAQNDYMTRDFADHLYFWIM